MRTATLTKNEPTNGAQEDVVIDAPYTVSVTIEGVADLLLHRWNCEGVAEKSRAKKGSAQKKTDNLESYVWRDSDGIICLPGEYFRQAIITAAKYHQDPRSPRKSAMDIFKAGVVSQTVLAPIVAAKARHGSKEWDYEDTRRVVVQRAGVNRTRPAFRVGWRATIDLMTLTPEHIGETWLRAVVSQAGQLVGMGDFRPTFGRFHIVQWTRVV